MNPYLRNIIILVQTMTFCTYIYAGSTVELAIHEQLSRLSYVETCDSMARRTRLIDPSDINNINYTNYRNFILTFGTYLKERKNKSFLFLTCEGK